MEFSDVIASRHSVRHFEPTPVPREQLERIIGSARRAPSSLNEQPWKFFVLTEEPRRQLGEHIAQTTIHLSEYMDVLGPDGLEDAAQWYSSLGDAPVLIAIASPVSEDSLGKLNRHLSVGAALENLLLATVNEGLSACNITFSHWVEDEIADLLGLPDDWDVLTVVAVGVSSDVPPVSPARRTDDTVWLD